jgi:hypothetical protein
MNQKRPGFRIRMAGPTDVPSCHAVDVEAWGEDSAASEEQLLSRIREYYAGMIVAEDETGRIIGLGCTMAMDEPETMHTWSQTSGEGTYRGVCNPHGDLLFGVNMSVRDDWLKRGVGKALVVRAGEIGFALGKRKFHLGSRIPHLHEWQKVFRAEDYVRLCRKGSQVYFQGEGGTLRRGPMETDLAVFRQRDEGFVDPRTWPVSDHRPLSLEAFDGELAFFLGIRINGEACQIVRLLPGYFPDPASCDYGVLVEWKNPAYGPRPPEPEEDPVPDGDIVPSSEGRRGPFPSSEDD